MDPKIAINYLRNLIDSRDEVIRRIERKRSMSASEKAMSISTYIQQRGALQLGIDAIKKVHGVDDE